MTSADQHQGFLLINADRKIDLVMGEITVLNVLTAKL